MSNRSQVIALLYIIS